MATEVSMHECLGIEVLGKAHSFEDDGGKVTCNLNNPRAHTKTQLVYQTTIAPVAISSPDRNVGET